MSGYTIGDNYSGTSSCSAPDWEVPAFARVLTDKGYVVTSRNDGQPYNHRVAGAPGVGHDDARWAETRWTEGSMAAYYENGAAFGGRWFAPDSPFDTVGVKHYGMKPRRNKLAKRSHAFARHSYLRGIGRHGDVPCPWSAFGTCD